VMHDVTAEDWRLLLRLFLAQRLELNAIESALKNSRILTDAQIREIRAQASDTAAAWVSDNDGDALALIRVHSSPGATMLVPPVGEKPSL